MKRFSVANGFFQLVASCLFACSLVGISESEDLPKGFKGTKSIAGFKIKDCQFQLFAENQGFWLEYVRAEKAPEVYFARYNKEASIVELGLNCPYEIKPKELRIKHELFSQLRVQSDGVTFEILVQAKEPLEEGIEVVNLEPNDSKLQIVIRSPITVTESPEVQPPVAAVAEEPVVEVGDESKSDLSLDKQSLKVDPEVVPEVDKEELKVGKVSDTIVLPKPDVVENTSVTNDKPEPIEQVSKPLPVESEESLNEEEPELVEEFERLDGPKFDPEEHFRDQEIISNISKQGNDLGQEDEYNFSPEPNPNTSPDYQKSGVDGSLLRVFLGVLGVLSGVLFLWYRERLGGARQSINTQSEKESIDLGSSYALLGVRASDSNDAIRKRYRHLMKVFHSDRVSSHDLPVEMVELANERFQQIQDAYEEIKLKRGF